MFLKSRWLNLTAGKKINPTGFSNRRLLQLGEQPSGNSGVLSLYLDCEIIKLFLRLRSMWSWMKVKVNIINTPCILMSEAVTVPSLMITSIVSDTQTRTERQTDRQTDTHTYTHSGSSMLTFQSQKYQIQFCLKGLGKMIFGAKSLWVVHYNHEGRR